MEVAVILLEVEAGGAFTMANTIKSKVTLSSTFNDSTTLSLLKIIQLNLRN